MHVWFLILAVLATFQPNVQVASTEDQSWKFIEAISPTISQSSVSETTLQKQLPKTKTFITTNSEQEILSWSKTVNDNNKKSNINYNNSKKNKNKSSVMIYSENKHENEVIFVNNNSIENSSENLKKNTKNFNKKQKISETNFLQKSTKDYSNVTSEIMINSSEKNNNNNNNINNNEKSEIIKTDAVEATKLKVRKNDNNDDVDDDNDNTDSLTYSNKDIISEKVTPDPSTLVQIENSLLSLFNMKRPPKIDRSKIVIPEAMKKLYAQIMGRELDSVNIPKPGLLTKSANTVRSFTHQGSKIDDRFPKHHRFRLHFDIKSIPAEEKLKAAELQLTRDEINQAVLSAHMANRVRYQVLVYDITRVGIRGKREPSYLLLDNKPVRLNSTDTISLDVQPAVNRWLASPTKNYGLLIEVRTMRSLKPAPHHHVRLRRNADESHDIWQHKQPLLFTYTDDGRHKSRSIRDVNVRSKRAGHHRRPHRRKNNEEICRRHSLYVDFADVGWSDWIVAPPGYDAFYCHGKCPFPLAEHLNSTNHAVVQTLVNNLNPGKVPKACCVPTQLEGISMLYLNDQSTVVLKNYQDMTVVGCGCR